MDETIRDDRCSRCGQPISPGNICCVQCTIRYYCNSLPRCRPQTLKSFKYIPAGNWNGSWDDIVKEVESE